MKIAEGDRLSSLPDDIIHKILSFIDIREAIGTGVLSSRWRLIWTSLPYLNFSIRNFATLPKFFKFVTNVLSRRSNLAEVYSMSLKFHGRGRVMFVKKLMSYAIAHNIQQLDVAFSLERSSDYRLSKFSSHSLKHLSLTTYRYGYSPGVVLTSIWELPTLTTLDLNYVTLRHDNADKSIGIISKCTSLKSLTLKQFNTTGSNGFCIFHPRLSNLKLEDICKTVKVVNVDAPQLKSLTVISCHAELVISAPNLASLLYKDSRPMPLSTHPQLLNLTLEDICKSVKAVNVDAPQLKNLTIRSCDADLVISAPNLASLLYKRSRPLPLSIGILHTLEKADICFFRPQRSDAHQIVCLLQLLHNAEFLTLNQEIVKILSSSEVPLLHQPSPFVNLKSLKIYPEKVYSLEQAPQKVTMSPALYSYLLDSSPECNFTAVVREELRAQAIMAQLAAILEEWKDNTKTNGAHLEQGEAHVESHKPKQLKIGENIARMQSCWKNLSEQIEIACDIMTKVQDIEKLLTKLPASMTAEIQPRFSSLCAEADIVVTQIKDFMRIQCDENQSLSSVCFPALATALETSSNSN